MTPPRQNTPTTGIQDPVRVGEGPGISEHRAADGLRDIQGYGAVGGDNDGTEIRRGIHTTGNRAIQPISAVTPDAAGIVGPRPAGRAGGRQECA